MTCAHKDPTRRGPKPGTGSLGIRPHQSTSRASSLSQFTIERFSKEASPSSSKTACCPGAAGGSLFSRWTRPSSFCFQNPLYGLPLGGPGCGWGFISVTLAATASELFPKVSLELSVEPACVRPGCSQFTFPRRPQVCKHTTGHSRCHHQRSHGSLCCHRRASHTLPHSQRTLPGAQATLPAWMRPSSESHASVSHTSPLSPSPGRGPQVGSRREPE